MVNFVAKPISRKNIRKLTSYIREQLGLSNTMYFPVVEFLEFGLPFIDENFHLEIYPDNEMPNAYAVTYPQQNKIVIREDVYLNAIKGTPRDRFTIAHEIGHYILHGPYSLGLARNDAAEIIPKYKEPEWQANTFAAELLAPPSLIKNLTISEIVKRCGVSFRVAEIQLKYINL